MGLAYADASSTILLYKTGLLDAFTDAWNPAWSRGVFTELTCPGYPGENRFTALADRGRVRILTPEPVPSSGCKTWPDRNRMDLGEYETLCLYLHNREGFILADDKKAARFCLDAGIPFINALLVPKLLYFAGRMDANSASRKTQDLSREGRYSDRIHEKARALDQDDLAFFIKEMRPCP